MKKLYTTLLILMTISPCIFAEGEVAEEKPADPPPKKTSKSSVLKQLYFGGAVRLSLGEYTVVGIEPMVGYKFSQKASAGVTARYDYIRDSRYSDTRETSEYGGSIFGRYRVTKNLYAQVEPAIYNHELYYNNNTSEREWVPYLYLGGGYRKPLGKRSWLYGQIMFDVLQDDKSPYDDWTPFFSIGAGTGF